LKLAKDNKTDIYYRPWTYDLDIIREVYKEYNISDFNSEDIVFDLGANIGSFSYRIAKIVKQVIAFEPDHDNFKIAVYNNRNNQNVVLFNSAIVGNRDEKRYLYGSINNTASYSLHKSKRNHRILVDCVNYSDMIYRYKPTIIKSDIEGEEYHIFDELLFNTIRIFIAEFHSSRKAWNESFLRILNSLLNDQNFILKEKIKITPLSRDNIVNLWRNVK